MKNKMAVLLNGIVQVEYHRENELSPSQRQDLYQMDLKMNKGIDLAGEFVHEPDLQKKAQFVAQQLYHDIRGDRAPSVAAMTSYLADRLPDLQQVKLTEGEQQVVIELIFDHAIGQQVKVDFLKN